MKVKKITEYAADYPKKKGAKGARLGALTAAALMAAGVATGCVDKPGEVMGIVPAQTDVVETPELDGDVCIDTQSPEDTDPPMLEGEPAVDVTEDPELSGKPVVDETEELELMGDVMMPPDGETP